MDKQETHYFYVLLCADTSLYAGYTNRLIQRIETHNAGKGAKYTRVRHRRPVRLVYAERFNQKSSAMRQEYRFKQFSRAEKIQYMKSQGLVSVYSGQCVIVKGREDLQDADSTELQ